MNRKVLCCVLLAVACVIAGILGCTTNSSNRILKNIGHELSIDISSGEIVTSKDTHGGFHSDGYLLVSVRFSDDKISKQLSKSEEWEAFPLDETAQTLIYGREIEGGKVGPFVTDRDGNKLFPQIEQGYYWLRDRQPETSQQAKKDGVSNCLCNFTVAVYDTQKNMLYYCKLDT